MNFSAKHFVALALIVVSPAVVADSRAVEELNYQASLALGMTDNTKSSGRLTDGAIGGVVTVPLAKYLGASVSGVYSQAHISDETLSCNLDSSGIGASFFARNYDIGIVGISYSRGRGSWCSSSMFSGPNHGSIDTEGASIYAGYFFRYFTVDAGFSSSRSEESGWDAHSYSVGAKYYHVRNLSVGLSASMTRTDGSVEHTPHLAFEYQPEIFGNSTSLTLGLSRTEYSNAVSLGITYFFDKRVDLVTRDRRYR